MPGLDRATLIPVYEGRGLVWMLLSKYDDAMADFQSMRQLAHAAEHHHKEGESLCHLAYAHYLQSAPVQTVSTRSLLKS